MAVYDLSHRLAKMLKKSDEYKAYLEARKQVMTDEKTKEMLLDFKKEQYKLQVKQFSGQEIDEDDKKRLTNLQEIVNLNNAIKKYMEAEYRVTILLNDVQEILFGDLEIGLPQDEEKHPTD